MVNISTFKQIALALPDTTEDVHFDKVSFKVAKKIFATLDVKAKRATLKFSPADQGVFCAFDPAVIYPVPNKWGTQGWTHVELTLIRKDMLTDALETAYCAVAPKRLSQPIIDRKEKL